MTVTHLQRQLFMHTTLQHTEIPKEKKKTQVQSDILKCAIAMQEFADKQAPSDNKCT